MYFIVIHVQERGQGHSNTVVFQISEVFKQLNLCSMKSIEDRFILAAETQYRARIQKQYVMCNINLFPLNLKVSL